MTTNNNHTTGLYARLLSVTYTIISPTLSSIHINQDNELEIVVTCKIDGTAADDNTIRLIDTMLADLTQSMMEEILNEAHETSTAIVTIVPNVKIMDTYDDFERMWQSYIRFDKKEKSLSVHTVNSKGDRNFHVDV